MGRFKCDCWSFEKKLLDNLVWIYLVNNAYFLSLKIYTFRFL